MKTFETVKTGYNYRIRKAAQIFAFIYDNGGELVDVITPGESHHRAALDWAEWREIGETVGRFDWLRE